MKDVSSFFASTGISSRSRDGQFHLSYLFLSFYAGRRGRTRRPGLPASSAVCPNINHHCMARNTEILGNGVMQISNNHCFCFCTSLARSHTPHSHATTTVTLSVVPRFKASLHSILAAPSRHESRSAATSSSSSKSMPSCSC